MTGQDIYRARRTARLSQGRVAEKLGLVHRGSLGDIESGAIEVTDAWALRAIGVISGMAPDRSAGERTS